MRGEPFARLTLPSGAPLELWCEDAIRGLPRRVGSGAADVVVTSPPYNRGVAYGRYRDDRPREEYVRWIGELTHAIDRVLAERGSFFLNIGAAPSDPWLPFDVAREVGRRFVLQNVIHWVKSIAIDRAAAGRAARLDRDLALGHYKPMRSTRYLHGAQEYVFHFTRRGDVPLDRLAIGVPYQDKSNVARWEGAREDVRCRGTTWFLPYPTIRYRIRDRPHPATFPPELPEWCVKLHGLARCRRIVDPFVGIGSTGVAAARLDRAFVGFDLDPAYLAVAAQRLTEAGASVPVRAPTRRSPRTPSRGRSRSA
jgi:site-specific DNA-methyltransferase (adenine-specific)